MRRTELDPEARRLLILIGGTVEQWILDHARETAEGRSRSGELVFIQTQDIQESMPALLGNDAAEFRALLERAVCPVRPSKLVLRHS